MNPEPSTPPLTVAYVGNFRHPFCTEVHVAGSLRQLGHTVVQLQEDELDWGQLARVAAGANVLLWTRTWPAAMDVVVPALDRLREQGVPSISYHLDRWWGLDREHQVADQPFFHTDLVVSPDGGSDHRWAEAGVNHLFLPPGVFGPECGHVPPDPRRYPHEVVFVGSHPYPHPEWEPYRTELIETLADYFGPRFGVYPQRRSGGSRPVRGKALQTLYATAKVVVGDSCLAGGATHYWSDRIPETLGRGGLLIHPEVIGLDEWYATTLPGGDLLSYRLGDFARVLELAEWALGNPSQARAAADQGRATVLGRDTYAHRMNAVLAHAQSHLGLAATHQIATSKPTRAAAALPGLGRADRTHQPTRVKQGRWAARFDLRADEPEDARVVQEVWARNDYRVPAAGFRGTVVDIGANVGAFSVLAVKAGARHVVAVEPELANLERLQHHVRINHLEAVVTVVPLAVVADDAATPLVGMVGAGGGAHVGPDGSEGHQVGTTTLAKLLAQHGPVEFLKIDCEGGEFPMIDATAPEVLSEHVERIALEWHGPAMPHLQHLHGDEFGALVTRLADCGTVETKGHPARGGLLHWRRY